MSESQDRNWKRAGFLFTRFFQMIGIAFMTLCVVKAPEFFADMESRIFTSMEQRVHAEDHIDNSLTEIELHQLANHVGNPDYHMPKSAKDSIYLTRAEQQEWIKKDIITNWQTKDQIDRIKTETGEMKALLYLLVEEVQQIKKKIN